MIGSLFSGIGGLELGLEMAGLGPVAWQCEQDPWCRKVLAKHWPDATRYEDVRTLSNPPRVDVMCGGFPCQDLSHAGKRAGLEGERSGLWWEYARLIHETQPRYVVIENVPGLLSDPSPVVVPPGLDWLGDRPTRPLYGAFGAVLWALDALGFNAVWDCVPASAVGAPHQRDRVFVVAYARRSDGECRGEACVLARRSSQGQGHRGEREWHGDAAGCGCSDVAYANGGNGRRGAVGAPRHLAHGSQAERHQGNDRARDRCAVAHSDGRRDQDRMRLPAVQGQGLPDFDRCDWSSAIAAGRQAAPWRYVGHTQQHGLERQHDARAAAGATHQSDGARPTGTAQPGLGRAPDGLPAGVDRPWQPWEGDTPRVAPKGPDWKHRGKALGNAVVPQVGLVAGLVVRQLMGAA